MTDKSDVALIAYAYPPYPASGALRARSMAAAFRRAGLRVTVITSRLASDESRIREEQEGLRVIAVPSLPHPRHLYVRLKLLLSQPGERDANTARVIEGRQRDGVNIATWKRVLLSLLLIPDDKQGFIPPAVFAAIAQYIRGARVIYTTSPPISSHVAGLMFKALPGTTWHADFRDPWTNDPAYADSSVRSSLSRRIDDSLARLFLRSADRIICATEGIRRLMATLVPDSMNKYVVARNGIPALRSVPAPVPRREQPFTFLHLGNLYLRRDPRPLLSGFARLINSRELSPNQLMIMFVGNCRHFHGLSLEAYAQDLGIASHCRFADWIGHDEATRRLEAADGLLLLAQDQPDQVPNKLYEYLGVRKPIVAIVDHEGEAANMLRSVGGHYIVTDNDPESIAEALGAAIRAGGGQKSDSESDRILKEWLTERQMDVLVNHHLQTTNR